MATKFTVSLEKIIETLKLKVAFMPKPPSEILINNVDVNRPGLQLTGFFDYFDPERIQLVGNTEIAYMDQRNEEDRIASSRAFFSKKPVAVIVTSDNKPNEVMIADAKEFEVPLLTTSTMSSDFTASLNSLLNAELAPRVTRHGVLVEVYGEGVLLMADSGVGKSETAIELVKRGHRFIADDAVEIRRVNDSTLVGSSPENIRHFLELRGIGIINVRKIFGIGSVNTSQEINMIINLENWDQTKLYERMGIEDEYSDILDVNVPSLTIPVKPGRNLAVIIEVAAMNNREKKMGYNAAHELLERLGMGSDIPESSKNKNYDF